MVGREQKNSWQTCKIEKNPILVERIIIIPSKVFEAHAFSSWPRSMCRSPFRAKLAILFFRLWKIYKFLMEIIEITRKKKCITIFQRTRVYVYKSEMNNQKLWGLNKWSQNICIFIPFRLNWNHIITSLRNVAKRIYCVQLNLSVIYSQLHLWLKFAEIITELQMNSQCPTIRN